MAKHLWQVKRPEPVTIEFGHTLFRRAIKEGITFKVAVRLVGYVLEMSRQKGWSWHGNLGIDLIHGQPLTSWLQGVGSGHRYAKGRNGDNYEAAGRLILKGIAPRLNLEEDTPGEVVWDALLENQARE